MNIFTKRNIIIALALIFPITIAFISVDIFDNKAEEIAQQEYNLGEVAGAKNADPQISELSDDLPLIPDSEIISLTKSDNSAGIIIETTKTEEEIRNFYDDYFFTNDWLETDHGTYSKDNFILKIEVTGNIVTINLQSNIKL